MLGTVESLETGGLSLPALGPRLADRLEGPQLHPVRLVEHLDVLAQLLFEPRPQLLEFVLGHETQG